MCMLTLTHAHTHTHSPSVVTVSFGTPQVTVSESSGFFTMCVVLNREALQDVDVELESVDGTAVAVDGKFLSCIDRLV